MLETRKDIINQLKRDVLLREGFKPRTAIARRIKGLDAIEEALPGGLFPTGAVHEFICPERELAAASGGFIAGMLRSLMPQGAVGIWISSGQACYPPVLKLYGLEPANFLFIRVQREKDVLWALEESLKYQGLAAVIAEVRELSFTESRRLQLAVETSRVTGFVLRNDVRRLGATACVARWQVSPAPSALDEDMPGVGHPRWKVELLKVRNGRTGSWKVEWAAGQFALVHEQLFEVSVNNPGRIAIAG